MDPTDGATMSGSQEMSDILNSYFSSVFTSENVVNRDSLILGKSPCGVSDIVCTPELVKEKLNGLKHGKAPGPDAVYPFILKSFADLLCVPLAIIFNKSLHEVWFQVIGSVQMCLLFSKKAFVLFQAITGPSVSQVLFVK